MSLGEGTLLYFPVHFSSSEVANEREICKMSLFVVGQYVQRMLYKYFQTNIDPHFLNLVLGKGTIKSPNSF